MLKLLKIKASGYRRITPDFEIDFTNKAKITSEDIGTSLSEIAENLYTFTTIAFAGKNSSGKSTALDLIMKSYNFLRTGRWPLSGNRMPSGKINLHLEFYLEGNIFFYDGELKNPNDSDTELLVGEETMYCKIGVEKLWKLPYRKSYGKLYGNYYSKGSDETDFLKNDSLEDTSAIVKLCKANVFCDGFGNNNLSDVSFPGHIVRRTFFDSLKRYDLSLTSSIVTLLDESIEYIKIEDNDFVKFKRFDSPEKTIHKLDLLTVLSDGTIRGVELFIRAINCLDNGGVFTVDEIENCFHKNLVNNIIFLFTDERINRKKAKLIFSTQYSQILDVFHRRDNIYVMQKKEGLVAVKNVYSDFEIRTELLKSAAFDNNTFATLLNYDQLILVRKRITDLLSAKE